MGRQTRNPWNVLLFFLVIVTVAYLCKRGWDGFYNSPGVWVSTRFIQLSHGQHWWTWDVPIPTADGIYSCVADAGDGRKIMWTCTVSGGEYTVSGLSKQGNVCEVRLNFSATMTPGASPSTTSAYTFPTYPSRHRPAYFGIDFWYCSPAGANYVLTVTQIYTPANAPLEYLKNLFREAGCDPRNLTEADLTVKYWRTLPSMDSIKNDIRNYALAYSTGSGSQAQKDFCKDPPPAPATTPSLPPVTIHENCWGGSGWSKSLVGPKRFNSGADYSSDVSYIKVPSGVTVEISYNGRSFTIVGPKEFNACGGSGDWYFNDKISTIDIRATNPSDTNTPPAAPAYMPPQTVNTNRVKRTKTCSTCPSAPLLSSLPTPSIAHNVNLPHYCQRVLDDGGI
jgi:hypothetical protein